MKQAQEGKTKVITVQAIYESSISLVAGDRFAILLALLD
jgi:hypothetical protein